MRLKGVKFVQAAFVVVLVLLVTVSLVPSPGTGDVDTWRRWAHNVDSLGIVSGFKANKGDYPPYTSVILLGAVRIARLLDIGTFGAVKFSIFLFLLLTSLVFWWWTRDFWITVILHLSLLLNSVALGYIDIFFAPSLILSIWALKERKLILLTIFYSIACLTKWQPIIIAPFLGMYILEIKHVRHWRQINVKRLIGHVLIPAVAIVIPTLSVFGVVAVLASLKHAATHDFLSGNALNFNWILTHWLRVFYPGRFGGLIQGQARYIRTRSLRITFLPRLLFFLSYISVMAAFLRRDKTFEEMINFSLMGYLAYFIFNTGVHENHLFLATILSVILFWVNRERLFVMVILLLMSNVNLFVFYGVTGSGLGFSRAVANKVDAALLLSIFNVCFFLVLWGMNVFRSKTNHAVRPAHSLDRFLVQRH
jgi:Gpi18-like mannosyltransferase